MKKLLVLALLALPMPALADHFDVIQIKLKDDCSISDYLEIVKDFNEQWAEQHDYKSEIAVPLQSDDLDHIFWVGRSKDAATFGAAWDAWLADAEDPDSTAAKLWERFGACGDNVSRRSYDVY